jgi:hypothetical protein
MPESTQGFRCAAIGRKSGLLKGLNGLIRRRVGQKSREAENAMAHSTGPASLACSQADLVVVDRCGRNA